MKIERVNDHQIRCTLTRDDLAKRDLKITELAYGTEKAKELFQDMMQQANIEFGFEAEDTPLMIEAIPINSECIVLVITKVDDPDELDTRFSNFAPSLRDEEDEDEDDGDEDYYDDEYDEDEDDEEDVMSLFKRLQHSNMSDYMDSPMSPQSDSKKVKEKTGGPKKKDLPGRKGSRIFSFDSLHEVTKFAKIVSRKFNGNNTLYKNEALGKYYLILHQGDLDNAVFANICSLLTEYGKTELGSTADEHYLAEHYTVVIGGSAVQTLSQI
ncbi:MAG: adaptor protein MecA [Butyrivibrio sp.]|jgi:adapter protein MecA 1/2|uniref:adaptor protein MecA n=1 Tax=Butyrivibrio sp. TaxID=28121 RepID=UPI001B4C2CB2|nr:adaptor protein MecA [Butyrivibrio sp.]MBP3782148.1 adaptor protein MecA [Butyrivibrio sp.]MBP3815038.1 adaptor protein MecA [Butyrivibrio sp.]